MTIDRIKGKVAFLCDLDGCGEGLETGEGEFARAMGAAREEGWLTRQRNGQWKHFCCANHEEMDWRGQKIVTAKP
jgi:hypothetical protein